MGNQIHQLDELEREYKNVRFVERQKRQRKKHFRDLPQNDLRDSGGAWDRDPSLDADPDRHSTPIDSGADGSWKLPYEPPIKSSNPRHEFILPDPVWKKGVLVYPLAERAGISEKQRLEASAIFDVGLKAKAKRKAHCGLLGQRWNCAGDRDHDFFKPYMCGCRYCVACAPGIFGALFAKHVKLQKVVEKLVPDWPASRCYHTGVVAKIDFTVRNTGAMPIPKEVRKFNRDIKKFFRLVESRMGISRKEYGVAWADEFGGRNTNLHAHAGYAGPWLAQKGKKKELSRLFTEIVGASGFVSIKLANSFPAALAHALKYTGKHIAASSPGRLAQLEKAFNGVRRVHALAAFFNFKAVRDSKPKPEGGGIEGEKLTSCPICQAKVYRPSGWHMRTIAELQGAGLRNYWEIQRDLQQDARSRTFEVLERGPP